MGGLMPIVLIDLFYPWPHQIVPFESTTCAPFYYLQEEKGTFSLHLFFSLLALHSICGLRTSGVLNFRAKRSNNGTAKTTTTTTTTITTATAVREEKRHALDLTFCLFPLDTWVYFHLALWSIAADTKLTNWGVEQLNEWMNEFYFANDHLICDLQEEIEYKI